MEKHCKHMFAVQRWWWWWHQSCCCFRSQCRAIGRRYRSISTVEQQHAKVADIWTPPDTAIWHKRLSFVIIAFLALQHYSIKQLCCWICLSVADLLLCIPAQTWNLGFTVGWGSLVWWCATEAVDILHDMAIYVGYSSNLDTTYYIKPLFSSIKVVLSQIQQ